jgi:DNA-binding MarR family transcriptional regulator
MHSNSRSGDIRFQKPDEDTSKQLRSLMEITRAFRDLSPTFPVAYMHAYLAICLNPGEGASEYMRELEVSQPVASRIILALGVKSRRGEEGMQLVDAATDPIDLRRKRTYLTAKGKGLFTTIKRQLERMK